MFNHYLTDFDEDYKIDKTITHSTDNSSMKQKVKDFLTSTPMMMSAGSVAIFLGIIIYATVIVNIVMIPTAELLTEPVGCGSPEIVVTESYDSHEQYSAEISWVRAQNGLERLRVVNPDGSVSDELHKVGESTTTDGLENGEEIVVLGVKESGEREVVKSYTVG